MKTPTKIFLAGLWTVFFVIGAEGVMARLTQGHKPAAYGSYIVWGLWVAAYVYFIGLSAGSFLLSSMITIFGVKRLEKIARLSLLTAMVTLLMALLSIWFDLGRMERAYRVITSPNFGSMMAWMIWLYGAYILVIIGELWLAMRGDLAEIGAKQTGFKGRIGRCLSFSGGPLSETQKNETNRLLRLLALGGVPLAIAFHGGVGALFGTLSARPFWHTPLVPILFLTGALVSGGGLMAFVVAVFWPTKNKDHLEMVKLIGRVVLGLLIFDVVLEWAEFSIPMFYGIGHEFDLLVRMLFGGFWWVFWILHVGLGTVIPAILLLTRGDRPGSIASAGLLIAVTFMTVRLNIVVPGLIEPNLAALQTAFVDQRLEFSYVPNFFEWQVMFFVVSVGIALFYLCVRFLPVIQGDKKCAGSPWEQR